jgi:hypothetical protein
VKLFLANVVLHVSPYMESSYEEKVQTLVWGEDYEDAERKVTEHYEVHGTYSLDKSVMSVELISAIGDMAG